MNEGRDTRKKETTIRPLSQLRPGQSGIVVQLAIGEPDRLKKLMAFGILPGSPISLLRRSPAFVLQIGQTQLAVDRSIAQGIMVETTP